MFEKIEMMRMARAMGAHASHRQVTVARNIANADTPGFKAQDLQPFADSYRAASEPLRTKRDVVGAVGFEPTTR